MSKGKKFDAHEKHFTEERLRLQRDIEQYRGLWLASNKDLRHLQGDFADLQEKTKLLEEHLERLLDYANLSEEDQKTLLGKARAAEKLTDIFGIFKNMGVY